MSKEFSEINPTEKIESKFNFSRAIVRSAVSADIGEVSQIIIESAVSGALREINQNITESSSLTEESNENILLNAQDVDVYEESKPKLDFSRAIIENTLSGYGRDLLPLNSQNIYFSRDSLSFIVSEQEQSELCVRDEVDFGIDSGEISSVIPDIGDKTVSDSQIILGGDFEPISQEKIAEVESSSEQAGIDHFVSKLDGFFAGYADVVSFGITTKFRESCYGDIATKNHQGTWFSAGKFGGFGYSLLTGGVAPVYLKGVSVSGRLLQGYSLAGTGVSTFYSTTNVLEGTATFWDALSFSPIVGAFGAKGVRMLRGLGGIDDFARFQGQGKSITLDFFGGSQTQISGAINVDIAATSGSRIKASISTLKDILPSNSVDEIIASGPDAEFISDAANLLRPGGKITINSSKGNPFGEIPNAQTLSQEGLNVIQKRGPLEARFANQTFSRTTPRADGSKSISPRTLRTTTLEKVDDISIS